MGVLLVSTGAPWTVTWRRSANATLQTTKVAQAHAKTWLVTSWHSARSDDSTVVAATTMVPELQRWHRDHHHTSPTSTSISSAPSALSTSHVLQAHYCLALRVRAVYACIPGLQYSSRRLPLVLCGWLRRSSGG